MPRLLKLFPEPLLITLVLTLSTSSTNSETGIVTIKLPRQIRPRQPLRWYRHQHRNRRQQKLIRLGTSFGQGQRSQGCNWGCLHHSFDWRDRQKPQIWAGRAAEKNKEVNADCWSQVILSSYYYSWKSMSIYQVYKCIQMNRMNNND